MPHFDASRLHQHVTYRLVDSLPHSVLVRMERELTDLDDPSRRERERRQRTEGYLDAGYGSCLLGDPTAARIVEDNWRHFDGQRYDLIAWVVMPNHVHVLIRPYQGIRLGDVVRSWKNYTSRRLQACSEGRPGLVGGVWQRQYWDRYVRNADHFEQVVAYIHRNPVAAGLCGRAEDWPFSSARWWRRG